MPKRRLLHVPARIAERAARLLPYCARNAPVGSVTESTVLVHAAHLGLEIMERAEREGHPLPPSTEPVRPSLATLPPLPLDPQETP